MLRRLLISRDVILKSCNATAVSQVPIRCMSYWKSSLEGPKEDYTTFDKSYAEWKYVERLIPRKTVVDPPTDHTKDYPSGWKPPNPEIALPYHIHRTKNHMLPVYHASTERGMLVHTKIKHVDGNIWRLEQDIGKYLKDKYPKKTIITNAHEIRRIVKIRGDYLEDVTEWAQSQGF